MAKLLDQALADEAVAMMDPPSRGLSGDLGTALEALIVQERFRRGGPAPLTGGLHPLALTGGHVLKSEFDPSIHAHTGWEAGAVIADVQGLIHVNDVCGFGAGEEVLRATASTLSEALPGTRLLRVHGDCLAALFVPSTGLSLERAHLDRAAAALAAQGAVLGPRIGLDRPLGWTVSALRLTIVDPPHWIVLGPLLLAEIERAHVISRRGLGAAPGEIQVREIRLDGRVPAPAATPRG